MTPDDFTRLRQSPLAMGSWQNAQQHLHHGRHAQALASYRNLVQQFPGAPQLWAELGSAAIGDLDFELAGEALQRAADLAGQEAALLASIGTHYYRLRRVDEAVACFKRAAEAAPFSPQMQLNLATWFERIRRFDEASESIETCLRQHPKDGRALYLRALLLQRKERESEAEAALRDLLAADAALPLEIQANASQLLAVILDKRGQYAEALQCLAAIKIQLRETKSAEALEQTYDEMDNARRKLLAGLTPEMLRRWREAAEPLPTPLALLCGAPRSGTTLVEQILGAHPDILVFDEPAGFEKEVLTVLHPPPPGERLSAPSLDALPPAQLGEFTRRYFKSVRREAHQKPAAGLYLDKNPAVTGSLPIWLRLFPTSKIIVALRDPRDVVISTYFQNNPVRAVSVNLLSLERTVKLYSDYMDVWLRMRELGGFDWIETRYEDIVNNVEAEGKKTTEFLNLAWHPAQAKYHEVARQKFIYSPTYNEVKKPVYAQAIRRWEHYAGALAPFQPALEKYLRAFGYD